MTKKKKNRNKKQGQKTFGSEEKIHESTLSRYSNNINIRCNHGRTTEQLNSLFNDLIKTFTKWMSYKRNFINSSLNESLIQSSVGLITVFDEVRAPAKLLYESVQKHVRLIGMDCNNVFIDLANYCFSKVVDIFLDQGKPENLYIAQYILYLALELKYMLIPINSKDTTYWTKGRLCKSIVKCQKYMRALLARNGNIKQTLKITSKHVSCRCLALSNFSFDPADRSMGFCSLCTKALPVTDLMTCSRCLNVEYCSQECQRQDWKKHKPYCTNKELVCTPFLQLWGYPTLEDILENRCTSLILPKSGIRRIHQKK